MNSREQGSDVTASQQDFWLRGHHVVIKLLQQVIAAIATARTDERGNVITPPKFMELMRAPLLASGKIDVAIKNILSIDRLISHLSQPVTACQKAFTVETAGRSNHCDLVAPSQSGRLNGLCRSGDLYVSQETLPGRSVAPDRAEILCHPSSAQPECRRAHAPSPAT